MARKPRIEKVGFYHVVNRGVARGRVYRQERDYERFLEIVQGASEEYDFTVHSYCLMDDSYHLLLQTTRENLSRLMQKINAKYSIYFNKKYDRIGPLWQGRFASWYVYDETYLHTLIRYIESTPIRANIARKIGEYPWAMSSRNHTEFSVLDFERMDRMELGRAFDDDDQKKLDAFMSKKLDVKAKSIVTRKQRTLREHFKHHGREDAILKAIQDGYTQKEIAVFLNLSHVAISKILKTYRQKHALFDRLKARGIFWSYSKEMMYHENLLIEYTLKYADFDDIALLLKLLGKRKVKAVWDKKMKSDQRFLKVNFMIARVFFGMDVESDYFKGLKNERRKKLELLAS